jgi:hypothetical protein
MVYLTGVDNALRWIRAHTERPLQMNGNLIDMPNLNAFDGQRSQYLWQFVDGRLHAVEAVF